TLLAEHGFSIVRSLEQFSAMQIGAVPGAWIAAAISDRWERKILITIVALSVAACGMIYGLSFNTWTIVIFRFLVAMGPQVFAPRGAGVGVDCAGLGEVGLGISQMRMILAAIVATLIASPAFAQIALTGAWAGRPHADALARGAGPEIGDYTGLPLNEAGRLK